MQVSWFLPFSIQQHKTLPTKHSNQLLPRFFSCWISVYFLLVNLNLHPSVGPTHPPTGGWSTIFFANFFHTHAPSPPLILLRRVRVYPNSPLHHSTFPSQTRNLTLLKLQCKLSDTCGSSDGSARCSPGYICNLDMEIQTEKGKVDRSRPFLVG